MVTVSAGVSCVVCYMLCYVDDGKGYVIVKYFIVVVECDGGLRHTQQWETQVAERKKHGVYVDSVRAGSVALCCPPLLP